ncbi:MAG: SMC-Scp complex subunit ScpB [Acidimicrobiia bacterium]|nr:SMC-Scp complex subunit ScpB [Acidimicrobiia bacterium]
MEAVLLAAIEPVEPGMLAQLLEVPVTTVGEIAEELRVEYENQERGFALVHVAGGYRYQTHPSQAEYVERFVLEGQHPRLSPAALETLAIVAYKQPISRGQISAVRGVNVDGVARTLLARGYIEEVGRDPGPGNATLYGTTQLFLERLGLASLDDLPSLGDFVPDATVVEALERGLRAPDSAPDTVPDTLSDGFSDDLSDSAADVAPDDG